jgi:multidrug efflux pump subunit AcrA (membrane-fusion protein)
MKSLPVTSRTLIVAAVLLPLLLGFAYVVARSGPLAPVPVTVTTVETRPLSPALFGIGTVEARFSYRIGPTVTGTVLRLSKHVGDSVKAGQVLGAMDPVDMANKLAAKEAAIQRANAAVIAAEARLNDSSARNEYADTQSTRYQELLKVRTVSAESADAKAQESQIAKAGKDAAEANLNVARQDLAMLRADYNGLLQQRGNLRLVAPVDGLVVGRYVEPGSTVVAGQAVIEVIDPASLWVNVRFDQLQSRGLAVGLPAKILLRSRAGEPLTGHVARIEPLADAITEELLAKVVFEQRPEPLPPVGELAEVTVALPAVQTAQVVPNASIKYLNGKTGVWLLENDSPRYVEVETGATDLDGRVQILNGLQAGDRVVVYSKQALTGRSRVSIVEQLVVNKK